MTAVGELAATTAAAAVRPTAATAAEFMDADVPNIETEAWQRSQVRSQRSRACYGGTDDIRAGGELYLPRHPNESISRYERRKVIAGFYNAYKQTIAAVRGLLLQQEPTLDDDMPDELKVMAENCDGAGKHLAVFANDLVTDGMLDGFAGIITEQRRRDDPKLDLSKASAAAANAIATGGVIDAADEKALGFQPYFILVKAEQVLPIYETVDGQKTLVLLVVRETTRARKGRFGFKSVTKHRVYSLERGLVMFETWEQTDGRSEMKGKPTVMRNLRGIPWSPFAPGEKIGENEYRPPIMDMVDLNIEHHWIKTGILSVQDLACVPTLVCIGRAPNKDGTYPDVEIGPGNTIDIPAVEGLPQTPVFWMSPDVAVLAPAQKSLENCKAELGAMGASFLVPQPRAQETATAHRADATAEQASITTVGRALTDCLESAFGFAGQYLKVQAGSVSINKEFESMTMDAQMILAWNALVQGGFDKMEAALAFQRAGLLSPDADLVALVQKWEDGVAAKEAADAMARADKLAEQQSKLEAQKESAGEKTAVEE